MTESFQKQSSCLTLRNLGVAYTERVVLSDITLDVPAKGFMALVGPSGTGKSTLLRTIAGFNRQNTSIQTWGDAEYRGESLSPSNSPVLVSQNSRLLTSSLLDNLLHETPEQFSATAEQKRIRALDNLTKVGLGQYEQSLGQLVVELPLVSQRLVAIARAIATDPPLILIDEPTYGLEKEDADAVLTVIKEQAEHRAVLVVLHNQVQVRSLGGNTSLMAGGVIQETQPTENFFESPLSLAGKEWIASGTCSEPSPDAREEDLNTGIRPRLRPPPKNVRIPSETIGPRGFIWLIPGKLAGTPRPGVVSELEYDLAGLKRVAVTSLISLMSTQVEADKLLPYGISTHWFPIPDMGAPDFATAKKICETIEGLIADGNVIAVHCRAGLGRTGTILVAYLIWSGQSPIAALETARRFEPKWVQSEAQIRFLEAFAAELRPDDAEEQIKAVGSAGC